MTYVPGTSDRRPILRTAAGVVLAFGVSAPLVWFFSNLVVYGLRSFTH